jgi:hypothetical protein
VYDHSSGGDVLPGPCKLRGAVGTRDDGLLELTRVGLRAARDVTGIQLGVASWRY